MEGRGSRGRSFEGRGGARRWNQGSGMDVVNKAAGDGAVTEEAGKKPYVSFFKAGPSTQRGHNLDFFVTGMKENRRVVLCPPSLTQKTVEEWEHALVGYFLGRKPSLGFLKEVVSKLWKLKGSVEIRAWSGGFFIFTFTCEEDKIYVLENGPWHVVKNPIILQPWKPSLRLEKLGLAQIPLWFTMPGLPLQFWSQECLSRIGSFLGKPMFTDKMTATKERISYARLCIEVSAEEEIPEIIEIVSGEDTFFQKVFCDWKPTRCAHCKVFGHSDVQCPRAHQIQKVTQVWRKKEIEKGKEVVIEDSMDKEVGAFKEIGGPSVVASYLSPLPSTSQKEIETRVENILKTVESPNRFDALESEDEEQLGNSDTDDETTDEGSDEKVEETILEMEEGKLGQVISKEDQQHDGKFTPLEKKIEEGQGNNSSSYTKQITSKTGAGSNSTSSSSSKTTSKKGGRYAKKIVATQRKSARIELKEAVGPERSQNSNASK